MKKILWLTAAAFWMSTASWAQTISVYPVRSQGFTLNESDVTEMTRIAMQSCYDAGLQCSGRGETKSAVLEEQGIAGKGKLAGTDYVAECALVGKTEDRWNVGTKRGGIDILGGAAKKVGGGWVGGASRMETSGVRIGGSGMNLTCQLSRVSDGVLAFSETDEKMGLSGELVLVEARSSNVKKLQKAFKKMFEHAKKRLQ